jgi:hypothetical protein
MDLLKLRMKLTYPNAIWLAKIKEQKDTSMTKLINEIISAAREQDERSNL